MKKTVLFPTIIFCLQLLNLANAQKGADLISGNLDFLLGAKQINAEFTYDEMAVGKYKLESQFIEAKVTELNSQKPGKGDKWLAKWNDEKTRLNEPNFLKLLNKYLAKNKITAKKENPGCKYTMVVKTKFYEKGWDSYVTIASQSSEIRLEIIFYETQNRDKELAKMSVNAYGSGGAVYSAYATAGKITGKEIYKTINNK